MWRKCGNNGLAGTQDLEPIQDVLQGLLLGAIGLQAQDDPGQGGPG